MAQFKLFGVYIDSSSKDDETLEEQTREIEVRSWVESNEEAHDDQTRAIKVCAWVESSDFVLENAETSVRFNSPKTDHVSNINWEHLSEISAFINGKSKGKKKHDNNSGDGKNMRSVKKRREQVQEPDPAIPQKLLQHIRSREGTTEPIFLYQKKLESSDLKKSSNRLFVTRREGVEKFLTDEENTTVKDSTLKIVGIDIRGKLYMLGLKIWSSMDMMAIKCAWFKLANDNGAEIEDQVQIWGYREMEEPCFAINFKKAGVEIA